MSNVDFLKENGIDVEKGIQLLGDQATYFFIMKEFLSTYKEKISKLDEYKESFDFIRYGIEAHSLKSDAKYLGFTKLADLAYLHEIAGKTSNVSVIDDSYDELMGELKRIIDILEQWQDHSMEKEKRKVSTKLKKSILIADDSSIVTQFLKETLKDKYDLFLAHNGKEVLEMVDQNKENLAAIFLDLNMPYMNGFEVLDYFQEKDLFATIPVSIISGCSDQDSIQRVFSYPVVDMLTKPFEKERIELMVEKTIQLKEVTE